ncbi:MAG: hypothetical protein ACYDCB_05305, partial [Candidatus Dormibacteria bacterium]
ATVFLFPAFNGADWGSRAPVRVFLQAAGLKSLHSVDDREPSFPSHPTDAARKARILGGVA